MKPFHRDKKNCTKKCELACVFREFSYLIRKALGRRYSIEQERKYMAGMKIK